MALGGSVDVGVSEGRTVGIAVEISVAEGVKVSDGRGVAVTGAAGSGSQGRGSLVGWAGGWGGGGFPPEPPALPVWLPVEAAGFLVGLGLRVAEARIVSVRVGEGVKDVAEGASVGRLVAVIGTIVRFGAGGIPCVLARLGVIVGLTFRVASKV